MNTGTGSERALNVREATFQLLRDLGLTTVFGNPGSTEETFLADFPDDFRFVLALQEASVIAIADGFAQASRAPALVNVHTATGLGNAKGNLMTAFLNRTPLIVTAGQQDRRMLLLEPWLTDVEPEVMRKPWVKWAYQPARAQDVPAAFMRAYATAIQPPAGPVFLSLPLDDWAAPALGPAVVRSASARTGPDPARLRRLAGAIAGAQRPVGDSILGNPVLTIEQLLPQIPHGTRTQPLNPPLPHRMSPLPQTSAAGQTAGPPTAGEVFVELRRSCPANAILVEETPSNLGDLHAAWPITQPDAFYTMASGGLGWSVPASVGVALAERDSGRNRPVVMVVGDGSFQYSLQSIWTAAQLRLPVLFIVLRNGEYAILKAFAEVEDSPGVPGLDIPGIDIVSLARGYGCHAARADTLDVLRSEAAAAADRHAPTVLEVPIAATVPPLL